MSDGGKLHEIVTPEGERVASCENAFAAERLEALLNGTLNQWVSQHPGDRIVNV